MSDTDHFGMMPPPAALRRRQGFLLLPRDVTIHTDRPDAFFETIRRELGGRKIGNPASAAVRLQTPEQAPATLRRWIMEPEGYGLRIDRESVRIWGATPAGQLYGVMTLCQLIRQYDRRLPCVEIGDAPALARRGMQLVFPQGHTVYRRGYMEQLIPRLARWKINDLYLYLESYFDFPSQPHMAGPGAMTPADARALDRLARAYNIRVVPMLNVLAHSGELLATQRYQHLCEYDAGKEDPRLARPHTFCTGSKAAQKLVDGMIGDFCDAFSSDLIHVGGDEVELIGKCPRCGGEAAAPDPLALYLKHYARVLDVLEKRGRKGGLWGDMLLHYATDLPRAQSEGLLKVLVRNAVIFDWQYEGGSPDSLGFFKAAGLTTMACSSSHLCYNSAMWPYQSARQRALFGDAIATGAAGGMTTAWGNFTGIHEEHADYLHAAGAGLLWSGPGRSPRGCMRSLTRAGFERAYCLQRYGLRSSLLTDYLHLVGDARGPILSVLAPLHGMELRKCLYHTDNVLMMWRQYAGILAGPKRKAYAAGVRAARRLWDRLEKDPGFTNDPLLRFQAGPLLMHEHLLARYDMTEAVYALYDQAAKAQYADSARFRALLDEAAVRLTAHLDEFAPIDTYLNAGRKTLGFDLSTLNRVRATKRKLRALAAFFRHLQRSHRPLPAFQQLADIFMEPARTRWYGDREHDWAAEPPSFCRYTLKNSAPDTTTAATAGEEPRSSGHVVEALA